MASKSLKDATLALVFNRPVHRTYEKIAADTGLNCRWIADFAGGRVRFADCDRVQLLYEYLSGKELPL